MPLPSGPLLDIPQRQVNRCTSWLALIGYHQPPAVTGQLVLSTGPEVRESSIVFFRTGGGAKDSCAMCIGQGSDVPLTPRLMPHISTVPPAAAHQRQDKRVALLRPAAAPACDGAAPVPFPLVCHYSQAPGAERKSAEWR